MVLIRAARRQNIVQPLLRDAEISANTKSAMGHYWMGGKTPVSCPNWQPTLAVMDPGQPCWTASHLEDIKIV